MRLVRARIVLALFTAAYLSGCSEPPPALPPAVETPVPAAQPESVLRLPKKAGSIRFAAIGDAGRGHGPQYEVSAQMQAFRKKFDFDFVVMLGDNVYDGATPEDYRRKFELPYKPLLDEGVRFYAVIGNHDAQNQPAYKPFNMQGRRYYTFRPDRPLLSDVFGTDIQFFMIDTEVLNGTQLAWLDRELGKSDAEWEIAVFHRPIYTSGRYQQSARILRAALEPILISHGVKVAFSGHEHIYERTVPQRGITYFISGAAGSLRPNDLRRTRLTATGFDTDYSFLLFEIAGDELFFQAISRTGHSVDHGVIKR